MTEGTHYAKLETVTTELQKSQSVVDEKLVNVENRMGSLEEAGNSYKESLVNMEVMICRVL